MAVKSTVGAIDIVAPTAVTGAATINGSAKVRRVNIFLLYSRLSTAFNALFNSSVEE